MIEIEVNCPYCGRLLSFFWDNVWPLNEKDIEHQRLEIRYINCLICSYRLFIGRDKKGWMSGIKKSDGTYLWRKQGNELS